MENSLLVNRFDRSLYQRAKKIASDQKYTGWKRVYHFSGRWLRGFSIYRE